VSTGPPATGRYGSREVEGGWWTRGPDGGVGGVGRRSRSSSLGVGITPLVVDVPRETEAIRDIGRRRPETRRGGWAVGTAGSTGSSGCRSEPARVAPAGRRSRPPGPRSHPVDGSTRRRVNSFRSAQDRVTGRSDRRTAHSIRTRMGSWGRRPTAFARRRVSPRRERGDDRHQGSGFLELTKLVHRSEVGSSPVRRGANSRWSTRDRCEQRRTEERRPSRMNGSRDNGCWTTGTGWSADEVGVGSDK